MEEYIWTNSQTDRKKKYLTLIIYDISDNKLRGKMVKLLKKFGMRVQKSAFEAHLNASKFEKLKYSIGRLIDVESTDHVKIYRLKGVSETFSFGSQIEYLEEEDVIFL